MKKLIVGQSWNGGPIPVVITMTWTCGVCHKKYSSDKNTQSNAAYSDVKEWFPERLPEGWQFIEGIVICDSHSISMDVDGEKHYLWGKEKKV